MVGFQARLKSENVAHNDIQYPSNRHADIDSNFVDDISHLRLSSFTIEIDHTNSGSTEYETSNTEKESATPSSNNPTPPRPAAAVANSNPATFLYIPLLPSNYAFDIWFFALPLPQILTLSFTHYST